MKLISLYIENFGGLSRYSLSFEDGLTAIEAENGFGKTTLAEFIRAMFYGFPRKGKTLDKSRRQKYTPWNGGKFGGNLVFETDGTAYRLERTFGTTPKGDSFAIIDLSTNKKSSRYTENIGLELFGLDADAFERSTYLPQMAETGSLTTDSIRSKLSNLVEDTNDVGNFEKAVAALKAKRSTYVPYRGTGGSVAQAGSRISQLQDQLRRAEDCLPELEACGRNIGKLETEMEQLEADAEQLRRRSQKASESAAIEAAHRQEAAMMSRLAEETENLENLNSRYPMGIPGEEAVRSAREMLSRLEILKNGQASDPEDLEAKKFLEVNQSRFRESLPTREALDSCREDCRNYEALLTEAAGKDLSAGEKELESRLKPLFDRGLLEKDTLEELAETNRTFREKCHQRKATELSDEERVKKDDLETYFASGLPDEMTLRQKQEELEQLQQLRQEHSRLEEAASRQPAGNTSPVPMILLLILGAGATAAGTVLLVKNVFLWGGIALGAGVLTILGGIFAGIRLTFAREAARKAEEEQNRIAAKAEKIRKLTQTLAGFTQKYSTDDMLPAALREIRENREQYLALQAKQREIQGKQRLLDAELEALERNLRRELGEGDFTDILLNLRLSREQHLELQNQKRQAEEEAAALREKAGELRQKIRSFLAGYGTETGEDLYGSLTELERTVDAYRRAEARVRRMKEEEIRHQQTRAETEKALAAFFASYGLAAREDISAQLLQFRDDRKDAREAAEKIEKMAAELTDFREENRSRLEESLPETVEDLEFLREEARRNELRKKEASQLLLQLQQKQRQLRDGADQIPLLRSDLENWQEKKAEDQHSATVLDDTVAFLEQAREELSGSYLGPIRRSFADYLHRLWADQEGKPLVTQDLEVLLERCGAVRELGYFSAGQADLVMLCMRLALVDALFGEESPCVILDDPFVNLDDAHTKQALELLKELSQNRQILYLTCSSSRTPN